MISRILNNPKISSIIIVGICALGILIGRLTEYYRFSEYRWIYQYGKLINYVLFISGLGWSMLHPIIVWNETKNKWKKHLIWILIGLIPAIYFFGAFTLFWQLFSKRRLTTYNGFMAGPLLKELKFLHLYQLPYNWKKVKAALPLLLIRMQRSCCPPAYGSGLAESEPQNRHKRYTRPL